MRIAINCQILSVNHLGIGRYTENLVKALADVDEENKYLLLVNSRVNLAKLPQQDNFQVLTTGIPIVGTKTRILWEQLWLPFSLLGKGVDLVHFPDLSLPVLPLLDCPYVVTIHDLTHYAFREAYTLGKVLYKRCTTPLAVRGASRIIAVSESTKQDIVETFAVPGWKIAAVYSGLMEMFKPITSKEQLKETEIKFHLPSRYILHVGSIDPRKNLVTLLEAYANLTKEANLPHKLIIVGPKEFNYAPVLNTAQNLDMADRIVFLGFVNNEDLVNIYNMAELFVFPSIHEGFGFPPLEAMACGVPVITSNTSSLPEIVGDAALLIDPYDTHGLVAAMLRVLTDDRLRNEMSQRGLCQAKLFSWRKAAEETLKVYKEAVIDAGKL
jgi:glycosyltransferase involved in cell wall biosynthesis